MLPSQPREMAWGTHITTEVVMYVHTQTDCLYLQFAEVDIASCSKSCKAAWYLQLEIQCCSQALSVLRRVKTMHSL